MPRDKITNQGMKLHYSIFLVLGCWVPVAQGFFLFSLFNRLLYFIFRPSVTFSFAVPIDKFASLLAIEDGKVYDLAKNDINAFTYRADVTGVMAGNVDSISFQYEYTNSTGGSFGRAVVDADEPFVLSENSSPYFFTAGQHKLTAHAMDADLVTMDSKTISWTLIDSSTG
jgi:hypothetical protein